MMEPRRPPAHAHGAGTCAGASRAVAGIAGIRAVAGRPASCEAAGSGERRSARPTVPYARELCVRAESETSAAGGRGNNEPWGGQAAAGRVVSIGVGGGPRAWK